MMQATLTLPRPVRPAHAGRLAVAVGAAALLFAADAQAAAAQDWRTMARSRQFNGESELEVSIEYGAGHLQVGPGGANVLYRTSLRYDADVFEPRFAYAGNHLEMGFEDGQVKGKNVKGGRLDLQLGPRAAVDLELQFGAAEATIELGGLRLNRLHLATGASATQLRFSRPNLIEAEEVEIQAGAAKLEAWGLANLRTGSLSVSGGVGEVLLDFTGEWTRDLEASIEMGLGSVTIQVPRGLGVRVERDGFLAGFDGEGLIKRGNVYHSENYEKARYHLSIDLEAALGSVRIVWVDG
jgi:hypothetical protein